jgi:hypothetical protein
VQLNAVVVQVFDPGDDVTAYPVSALPPFEAGALHDTVAWWLPGAAFGFVGAPGAVLDVVTLTVWVALEMWPCELVAVTEYENDVTPVAGTDPVIAPVVEPIPSQLGAPAPSVYVAYGFAPSAAADAEYDEPATTEAGPVTLTEVGAVSVGLTSPNTVPSSWSSDGDDVLVSV